MIIRRSIWIVVFILFLLFTSMFVSIVSIYEMPTKVLGGKDIYVMISSQDKNPIRSNIDIAFAYGIENLSYIQAVSPEIYAFTMINGKSATVRGVIFSKFFKLQGGGIVSGSLPHTLFDALIGINARKMLGVDIGDVITLRGSFSSSVAIVNISGVFKTNSPADDEILVSIPTAEKLAGINPRKVSIIRIKTSDKDKIEKLLDPDTPKFIVYMNMSHTGFIGEHVKINATVKNMGHRGGKCILSVSFENKTKVYNLYVNKEKNINLNFTLNKVGVQNITAVVKNDIFYYTCYTQISVYPKPVFMRGPIIAFSHQPVVYTFKTLNNESIENGTLIVESSNYKKIYMVNETVNIIYPNAGKYTLKFVGDNFENQTFNVSVYDKVNMSKIALVLPEPINGTLFLNKTDKIRVYTGGKVYYSFDGGNSEVGKIIPIPSNMNGNHILNLTVISWRYMAKRSYPIHIIEDYPPAVIAGQNDSKVLYGSHIKFVLRDPVPILNVTVRVNGITKQIFIGQRFNASIENYTYIISQIVNKAPAFDVHIYFKDVWGRSASYAATYSVVVSKDIEKPHIIVAKSVKIWSGNNSVVKATDNVAVKNITVYVNWSYDQKIFSATRDKVCVPTVFKSSNEVIYVSEGIYNATVVAYDVSGNRNETNFTIIVNNSGEKNPPILVGNQTDKGYYNLTAGWIKFVSYDNVAVKWIGCYEKIGNTYTLVKSVYGNSSTQNLTLYLNSTDFSDGVHYLLIGAYDINLNFMDYVPITVIKNYVDDIKPEIHIANEVKMWGGNSTTVKVSDNVAVHNVIVYVNWSYPQKMFASHENNKSMLYVTIPTSFQMNGQVIYVSEGIYNATVVAYDVSGNRNETNFTIIVNNSGEKNPPIFTINDYLSFGFLESIKIYSYDNVYVKKMWMANSSDVIVENNSNNLILYGKYLKMGYNHLIVYAEDVNGNTASKDLTILITDDVKPHLISFSAVIWGGNTTIIRATDNVQVSWVNVSFEGNYYNNSGNEVVISTVFINDSTAKFLSPGDYSLVVRMSDAAGNVNVSLFHLIINNTGEKNPPVIIGKDYGTINISSSLRYVSFDNVAVSKIWIAQRNKIIKEIDGWSINLTYHDLSAGTHNLTVYAEDINGNIGSKDITVSVAGVKKIDISAYLLENKIKENQNGVLVINLQNSNTLGYYNLSIYIDDKLYYTAEILMHPYERKSLNIELPPLSAGNHTITVGNLTLKLQVLEQRSEKLPTDLVLKYIKNMKFSESKNVIYKGFQISEGNFMLLLLSLMMITLILLLLGLYSSMLKGIKNQNIGILRAIGASNKQILWYFINDSMKYIFMPIFFGVACGYGLIILINNLDILTALGHRLIIAPTPLDILMAILISLVFSAISLFFIFKSLLRKRVVHIMGAEEKTQQIRLEEILESE